MPQNLPSLTAVVNQFPAPSQTFILRKLEGLRVAGMHIEVAGAPLGADAAGLGFPLIALTPWQLGAGPLSSYRRGALAMGRALLHRDPTRSWRSRAVAAPLDALTTDIVHFEFSAIAATYVDALDGLRRRARIAVSCRGTAEQVAPLTDPGRAERLRRVFELSDLIHCVSDDMRATVEALGAPSERILVNRPAVPTADFRHLRDRAARVDGPLRVLSVGRLHWKKGHDDGLRAVAELRSRGCDVELRIAGDGGEREKLTFMIEQLGLGDAVTLLGTTSQAEVVSLLGWADAMLLPSLSEGISNSVLEAMAAGLPVVTTSGGGMTEAVTDDREGLVVPVGDTAAMAEALGRLADDPGLRARLGSAGAERADREFDLERQIRTFVDAYRSLS